MKKFGIKKTWGNIILLFCVGMIVGIVVALRQPIPQPQTALVQTPQTPEVQ